MKTKASPRFLCLIAAMMAMAATAVAQTNLKMAFDAIIKCRDARITERHTLEKDPATNVKTGQSDVYQFEMPASKIGLVKNVISAFGKDSDKAYSINSGTFRLSDPQISLAVGDGNNAGERITEPGYEYAYATFLAPKSEDPSGIYRYAYGVNYREEDGKVRGTLVITYATTLQHRQAKEQKNHDWVFNGLPPGSVVMQNPGYQPSWFDTLMSYFQSMTSANSQTRIALATKAFKLIQNSSKYPEVTSSEKAAVREILKGMISEKKYSESVLNTLLNQSLKILK